MENLLISACLMGFDCKYSGGNNRLPENALASLRVKYHLIPVCPEFSGGLPTPRDPSERRDGGVYSCKGADVTEEFERGADIALTLAERFNCKSALLKEKSPSCGGKEIYDGTFTMRVIPGVGVTAEKLIAHGIEVCGESETEALINYKLKQKPKGEL